MDTPGSSTKNAVTLEYPQRFMHEPTRPFINNVPFNPHKFLRLPLLFHFTDIGTKVLVRKISRPGFESWVSSTISRVLSTLSCHYPLIIKPVLKLT